MPKDITHIVHKHFIQKMKIKKQFNITKKYYLLKILTKKKTYVFGNCRKGWDKKFSPITIKIENSVSYNEQVFSIKKKQNNKIL